MTLRTVAEIRLTLEEVWMAAKLVARILKTSSRTSSFLFSSAASINQDKKSFWTGPVNYDERHIDGKKAHRFAFIVFS